MVKPNLKPGTQSEEMARVTHMMQNMVMEPDMPWVQLAVIILLRILVDLKWGVRVDVPVQRKCHFNLKI